MSERLNPVQAAKLFVMARGRSDQTGEGEDAHALALLLSEFAEAGRRQGATETQESISAWCEQIFGPITSHARIAARANEEMAELLKALTSDDRHQKAAEEIADVFIVLYRLATRLGVNIHAEIDRKMAVNRAREWKLDGTGHGYHVRKTGE